MPEAASRGLKGLMYVLCSLFSEDHSGASHFSQASVDASTACLLCAPMMLLLQDEQLDNEAVNCYI